MKTTVTEWDGFEDGDLCYITGEKGDAWTFKSVTLKDGVPQWVSVHGPVGSQQRMWRSFDIARLDELPRTLAKRHGTKGAAEAKAKVEAAKAARRAPTPANIRAWAAETGVAVPPKRIPAPVREAFLAAMAEEGIDDEDESE